MVVQPGLMSPQKYAEEAYRIVNAQNEWRGKQTLNLIASENVMSPKASQLYYSDFEHRYAEGEVGDRYYEGVRYADDIEDLCEKSLKTLFSSDYVNVKPISGAQANLAVFYAYAKAGDTVMSLDVPSGGHISYREFGAAGCRGLIVNDIPYDSTNLQVDFELFTQRVRELKGRLKMITLGGSLFMFPHPIKEISRLVKEELPDQDVLIHYDAAHVLGLIAGGKFQDPFREGAKVMTSSTHKTFPGPQGGLAMGMGLTEKQVSSLRKAIFPGLISNHHLHRLPSLLFVTAEMMMFGKQYAQQIVSNAKTLARSLDELGFKVIGRDKGYTESHQVAFDASPIGGATTVATKLTEANIITNKNLLPGENLKNSKNPSGIRLGVQEVTRFGMREKEMEKISQLFRQLLMERVDSDYIRREVLKLRQDFHTVQYTF
jgi:glycine hydroxymethyltransferase